MQSMREQVFAHVAETYHVSPDYPWMRYPRYAVFRHAGSGKWFGLVMDVPRGLAESFTTTAPRAAKR